MDLLFFMHNILLLMGNTLICVGFIELYHRAKKRLYLWLAVLFGLYVIDILFLSSAEFVPSLAQQGQPALISNSPFYIIVLIATTICMRLIMKHLFDKPLKQVEVVVLFIMMTTTLTLVASGQIPLIAAGVALLHIVNCWIIIQGLTWLHHQWDSREKTMDYLLLALGLLYFFCAVLDFVLIFVNSPLTFPEPRRIAYDLINIGAIAAAAFVLFRKSPFNKQLTDEEIMQILAQEHDLTKRERQILSGLVKGYTNKKISELEYISIGTVKAHTHNLYAKLGVNNREAVIDLLAQRKKNIK